MKLSKTQKGIGIAAVVGLLGYFGYDAYRKRWQMFSNFGMTQWIDGISGNVALELVNPSTNVAAGDTILIEHGNDDYPTGEIEVLRVVQAKGSTWVVLDYPQMDSTDTAGRFKLVKKAA
jgi:hypothetical protein